MIREAHERDVGSRSSTPASGRRQQPAVPIELEAQDAGSRADRARRGAGVDGINVDVEAADRNSCRTTARSSGGCATRLRASNARRARSRSTTQANEVGAAMAAGGECRRCRPHLPDGLRLPLGGSQPGASAPIDRMDGERRTWSGRWICTARWACRSTGRSSGCRCTMRWHVAGHRARLPGAVERTGRRLGPAPQPGRVRRSGLRADLRPDGERRVLRRPDRLVTPRPRRRPPGNPRRAWRRSRGRRVLRSPRSLEPKLRLADERGLAGAGFWAIGYERGMPDYTKLMKRFAAGRIE